MVIYNLKQNTKYEKKQQQKRSNEKIMKLPEERGEK